MLNTHSSYVKKKVNISLKYSLIFLVVKTLLQNIHPCKLYFHGLPFKNNNPIVSMTELKFRIIWARNVNINQESKQCIHTQSYKHRHTYIHTYTYIQALRHIYTHIHTYTHTYSHKNECIRDSDHIIMLKLWSVILAGIYSFNGCIENLTSKPTRQINEKGEHIL